MPSTAASTIDLRCEYHSNPLGIDVASPRLSWKFRSGIGHRRGLRQSAYQVRVATSLERLDRGEADLWDSGRVESDLSIHVPYEGKALGSGVRAWWNVRGWDAAGDEIEEDYAGYWETGLLTLDDWAGAQWIGGGLVGGPETSVPCPYLRRMFTVPEGGAPARLYVTALGVYDVTINGKKVGADLLTPGWTDYHDRVQYQTYDVTGLLRPGENVIGAVLGDGWYCGYVGAGPRQLWGDRPYFLATLTLDGKPLLVTDDTWRVAYGPLLAADLIQGESYDARREMPGWDADAGFDDASWHGPVVLPDSGIERVSGARGVPVRAQEELAPIADPQVIPRWPAPNYIFDFGQNLVGTVRLRIQGERGTTVRLRFAEVLKGGPPATTGPIYTENLRSARQTDHYTLRGDPEGETWEPRFTFHGFRYVEVTLIAPTSPAAQGAGVPTRLTRDSITAVVVHSDTPKTGDFSCSDPLLNQLQKNIDWGQRGNFLEVPTDCPQRDERLGWTGDAQVFIRTAAFNRDVAAFFTKWTQDLRDAQRTADGGYPPIIPRTHGNGDGGPAWSDAGVICPWTVYLCYGDERLLAEHYDSMVAYMDHIGTKLSRDGIRSYEGLPAFRGFGDWLNINAETPHDLIGTAFLAYDAHLMAKIAAVLGKAEDAARYTALFERVRSAFQHRFLTPEGLLANCTQTAYVLALHFDLLPAAQRAAAVDALVRDIERRGDTLSTGFVGSPYLPHVLSDNGRLDVAYRLLHQKRWPSWLYAVTQGATTIWERWDGWTHDKGFQDAGMNSFNHYAYGAIGAWLYRVVAGIDLDEQQPGGKRLLLRPRIDGSGLTQASAHLDTPYGRVESAWRLGDDGAFAWNVTVPANTSAEVHVPCTEGQTAAEADAPVERSAGLRAVGRTSDAEVFEAAPGSFTFTVSAKPVE